MTLRAHRLTAAADDWRRASLQADVEAPTAGADRRRAWLKRAAARRQLRAQRARAAAGEREPTAVLEALEPDLCDNHPRLSEERDHEPHA